MKHNWEYKKLSEVVSFIGDGDWIESRHQSDNGIRLIQTGNIGNGVFKAKEDRPHFISESTFDELGCTEIYEGDCLVSRLPDPIGRACIIPNMQNRMITAVDCSILRFQKLISSNFFVYYTRSKRYNKEIENYTTGSTRKRISRRNLESVQVPVPPLSEQSRIVAELDLLTGIIDKQNAQLKELDNLAQAIFYDMFGDPIENPKGWEVQLLKQHTTKIGSGATPKGGNESYKSEGIPLIRSLNVYNGTFKYKDLAHIDENQAAALDNVILQGGDVLLNITGASVARCCIVPCDLVSGRVNQHVAILRPKDSLKSVFLCAQLISSGYQQKLLHDSKANGATREALTKSQLEGLPIILPSLSLQQSFAKKIQSIEKQKETIRASIADTQKLLDYTMDKYFG